MFLEKATLYFSGVLCPVHNQHFIKNNKDRILFSHKAYLSLKLTEQLGSSQQNVDLLNFNKESQILTHFSSAAVRIVHLTLRGVALRIMLILFS